MKPTLKRKIMTPKRKLTKKRIAEIKKGFKGGRAAGHNRKPKNAL